MSLYQNLGKTLQLNLKRCSAPILMRQNRGLNDKALTKIDELLKPKDQDKTPSDVLITVEGAVNVAPITGIPEEHIKGRLVRIYKTPKNAMQSGTENVDRWEIEFDTRTRWENPLMGWTSTGDPHSNLKVQFNDLKSAVNYAERNGWQWFLEPEKKVKPKVKSYGFNFSWNKRTRVSTK